MATLVFTGKTLRTTYPCLPFEQGMEWLRKLKTIGLDTETNVTSSIIQRELKVISIADEHGKTVWVIQWEFLTEVQQKVLLDEIKKKLSVIQNVAFDYQVLKKYGLVLENTFCTYLAEQALSTGLGKEAGFHGLQAIFKRRFDIDISKDEQMTFGDTDFYSDRQIMYAGVDSLKLCELRRIQLSEMKAIDSRTGMQNHKGIRKANWWDNEFIKVVGDMETTGVRIDKEKWYAIEDAVKPVWDEELLTLNELTKEYLYDTLIDNNWVSDEDTITVSVWTSSTKKLEVLNYIYNFEVTKTSQVELKKLLQENDPNFPPDLKLSGKSWESSDYPRDFSSNFSLIKLLILYSKNKEEIKPFLDKFLIHSMVEFCHTHGWLRRAGEVTISWSSPVQRLKIFQAIDPSIESTGKDVIVDYIGKSPIIAHYLEWNTVDYQIKMFGRNFYDKHVEVDGKFRTRFNIVLATGRLSSTEPNLLNIPRKIQVYREAVIPDPGFNLIDADYDGKRKNNYRLAC